MSGGRFVPVDATIYVMNAGGSGAAQLVPGAFPAWSPDGTRITFSSFSSALEHFDIYVMNADTSGRARLTESSFADDFFPDWSPDGTRIAFSSERAGGNREIYSMNADGSGQIRLTDHPAPDVWPRWSPADDGVGRMESSFKFRGNDDEIVTECHRLRRPGV